MVKAIKVPGWLISLKMGGAKEDKWCPTIKHTDHAQLVKCRMTKVINDKTYVYEKEFWVGNSVIVDWVKG